MKLNSKRSKIAQLAPQSTPKEAIEAVAPSESKGDNKKAAPEELMVHNTLQNLKEGINEKPKGFKYSDEERNVINERKKQTPNKSGSRIYSIPNKSQMENSPTNKLTGQIPNTVNVYGAHYPVVRVLNDGNTILLHTSNYGESGKTTQLVDKVKNDLPNVFPNAKVIEIHHPDYKHSAKVMRIRDEQNVHKYLEDASQNHPDENYRQHALQALEHLRGIKKAEYSKPIHAKRTEGEGWDYNKNVSNRLDRLHRYLSKVGLTVDLDAEDGRKIGATSPSSIGINRGGDPHDQQILHEAGHAMLAPEGKTLGEYQAFIGKPGFEAKHQASAHRDEMQAMHGGGMPEQTAQHMEAGIARRAGIEPFRTPKRGVGADTAEEMSRKHASRILDLHDEGILSVDPFTGEKEIGTGIDALINAKARAQKSGERAEMNRNPKDFPSTLNRRQLKSKPNEIREYQKDIQPRLDTVAFQEADLRDKIREKFKQHIGGHQELEDSLAASEKDYVAKSIVDEMFEVLAKGSLQRKNPFNPQSKENKMVQTQQRSWTHDEEDSARQTLPKMEGSARLRALNKLSAKTHVRKDPSSGERLFLMHRGMGVEELKGSNSGGVAQYEKGTRTSWTPDKDVAGDFGGTKTPTISAWVPESALVHSVNQFNSPSKESVDSAKEFNKKSAKISQSSSDKNPIKIQKQKNRSVTEREEQEWVVEHNQPFQHAHPRFMARMDENKALASGPLPRDPKEKTNYRAEAGVGQMVDVKALEGDDRKQVHDDSISSKGKIGSKDKHYSNFKTNEKLAASENTKPNLKKTLTAGSPVGAPSTLSGGSALQVEQLSTDLKKPFKSKKQRRFAHANPEKFGGKKGIKEWESKTPDSIPEVAKGESGDWQKEGYKISHNHHGNSLKVHAHDKAGNKVGSLTVFPTNDDRLTANNASVDKEHRRKGLASAMYEHSEKVYDKKFDPKSTKKEGRVRTPEGNALWNQPNRKFGKSERIKGGLADKKKPSDFDKKKLKAGAKVESEHTSDKKVAQEIAMDHLTEDKNYYKKLKTIEKMEIPKPIKAGMIVTALASAGHQMMDESRVKPQSREVASREQTARPQDVAYESAYNEGMKIRYVNDFKNKPSRTVIKETIKRHPDLSESHGYMLKLSPNAFKEVVQHSEPLVKEVGSRYYDHLHKVFQGDQDKIDRAWSGSVKGAKEYVPETK
jgi:predicted GNAT family acetyltransferase